MGLAEKYRPRVIDDMEGGEEYAKAVQSALDSGAHAFLLIGPSGTGKTTLARAMAHERLGGADVLEIDAASAGSVDDARQLGRLASNQSMIRNKRLIIVDECHAASKQAWQSLLKPIEEPAPDVVWAFCTTEEAKVPKTIKTRCATIHLKSISTNDLADLCGYVASEEGWSVEDAICHVCAIQAHGSVRQALQNLGMVWRCKDRAEAANILKAPADSKQIVDFCRMLIEGTDWKRAVKVLHSLDEVDPESLRLGVLNYTASVIKGRKDAPFKELAILEAFSEPCRQGEGMAPIYLAVGGLTLNV